MKRNFNDQELARRAKLKQLKELGVEPYTNGEFKPNKHIVDILDKYKDLTKPKLEKDLKLQKVNFKIYGRIMLNRDQGKMGFFHIKDSTAKIQVYINSKGVKELDFKVYKLADIGDWVGIQGNLMVTNTGELTIRAKKYTLLSKSLKPLPEKYHGLSDIEEKYRRRYVDLIVNDDSRKTFITRTKIIRTIQNFLDKKGYIEVETPMLHETLGGASAKPFKTHHNSLNMDLNLRIATELHLKRLIVGGFEKVYEIGRIFRNEGISTKHNPEFTSIELYEANGNLETMKSVTEGLVKETVKKIHHSMKLEFDNNKIDFSKPFKSQSMIDLVKKETGIDFEKIETFEQAKNLAKENKIEVKKHMYGIGHILTEFFEKFCESKLIQPTFVTDFPIEVSPLARKKKDNERLTERFELFIAGREYANAFSELNDPNDQYERFKNQLKEKELGSDEASEMDIDYIEALEYGMLPTGGMGLGIDRLVMLLTGNSSIRDVLLFPQLKKEINEK